jgi:hypothetical protein
MAGGRSAKPVTSVLPIRDADRSCARPQSLKPIILTAIYLVQYFKVGVLPVERNTTLMAAGLVPGHEILSDEARNTTQNTASLCRAFAARRESVLKSRRAHSDARLNMNFGTDLMMSMISDQNHGV